MDNYTPPIKCPTKQEEKPDPINRVNPQTTTNKKHWFLQSFKRGTRPARRCGKCHQDQSHPWRSCWSEQWCCWFSRIHYSSHRIYAVPHPSSFPFTHQDPNFKQPHFTFLSLNAIFLSGSLSFSLYMIWFSLKIQQRVLLFLSLLFS